MIDTHAHLYAEEFDADFDATIDRAEQAGIDKIIFPAIDSHTFDRMMDAQKRYPNKIYTAIGLHPTSVAKDTYKQELEFVEQTIKKYPFVAIGEIGIDCYWTTENIEWQRIAFEHQLEMASERNLPVIIHARNSFDEIFAILDKRKDLSLRGVFHAFSGSIEDYQKARQYKGFLFGLGGVVTFKNGGMAEIVEQMSIDEIVLETDSPYMTPVPFRGKRNESAYIQIIARKIADIKQIDFDLVARATTLNAENLFCLK